MSFQRGMFAPTPQRDYENANPSRRSSHDHPSHLRTALCRSSTLSCKIIARPLGSTQTRSGASFLPCQCRDVRLSSPPLTCTTIYTNVTSFRSHILLFFSVTRFLLSLVFPEEQLCLLLLPKQRFACWFPSCSRAVLLMLRHFLTN